MKKISLITFAICLMFTACNADIETKNNNQSLKNEESKNLEKMHDDLTALSGSNNTCTNNNDWDFVPIGTKSCGGPEEYIIYSLKINTADFFAKIKAYNKKQQEFNSKWQINSTCNVVDRPELVDCVDGKPTLIYNSDKTIENENLKKMYNDILALSDINKGCAENNDWNFTPIGSKPCGGPTEYIIYSTKINTTDFLAKVRTYTAKQFEFNTKWRVNSTCEVVRVPESVNCVNGKPTLLYESDRILENENLKKMYNDVVTLSGKTKPCTDVNNWAFTTIGANSCGKPSQHIIYSKTIDVPQFLAKVNAYTEKQIEFNKKWYPVNEPLTCAPIRTPESVNCVDGEAQLVY